MKQLFSALFIVVMTAATTLPVQAEVTMTCTKTSAQEIAALFDRWNASLATLDPDKMAALYAPDAVLLPTVSNKPRTNHEEIRDYFVHFLEKKPQGKIDFASSRSVAIALLTRAFIPSRCTTQRAGPKKCQPDILMCTNT